MKKPGRNDPCPCGSGRKYKYCCLEKAEAGPRFTQADRQSAIAKLERFADVVTEQEREDAYEEFWAEEATGRDALDESWIQMSDDVFGMWFWFDRPLADGQLLVDRVLAEDPSLAIGERRYLEFARETCMRLYEVVDSLPGISITLRDLMDEAHLTVHEERGSRQFGRSDLLVARIIGFGVSAQPELEAGVLPMSRLLRGALVSQLSSHFAEFRRENRGAPSGAFFKDMAPVFHSAWVSGILNPPIPRLQNTDGEDMLITRIHFDVRDSVRLAGLAPRFVAPSCNRPQRPYFSDTALSVSKPAGPDQETGPLSCCATGPSCGFRRVAAIAGERVLPHWQP